MKQSILPTAEQNPQENSRINSKFIIGLMVLLAPLIYVCASLSPPTSDTDICTIGTFSNTGAQHILGGRLRRQIAFVWLPDHEEILYNDIDGNVYKIDTVSSNSESQEVIGSIHGYEISTSSNGNLVSVDTIKPAVEVYSLSNTQMIYSISYAYDSIISPNGQFLVVIHGEGRNAKVEIFLLEIVNKTLEKIININNFYYPISWSKLSGYLVLGDTIPDKAANGLSEKILLFDIVRQKLFPLVDLPGCQWMPTWSPDDRQVIFTANPELWNWNLYQVEIGKDAAKMLTNTPEMDEFQPDWSPDGESIVYVGFKVISDPVSEQELYRLDLSSGDVERLTNTPDEHESYPRWSPDGKKIAYLSYADNTWYLNVMNPDGSGQVRVATIGESSR